MLRVSNERELAPGEFLSNDTYESGSRCSRKAVLI
jgi:hypothetical protein